MLVSVIIPSFRQPQFLGRAIESVLEQDYTALEVIVVDDRSLDESLAIALDAMQRDPRVRVLARRNNGGLGRARNTGLASATGELVTFLDADDYLLPGAISGRVDVWKALSDEERATVTGVYGDWQHVGEHVDHPSVVRSPRRGLLILDASTYTGRNVFICSSPLLRPKPLLEVGGFAEGVPMLEDYVAWARLLAAGGSFVPAEVVVCVYRQRPTSMLRGKATVLMQMVTEINRWLGEHGVEIASDKPLMALQAGKSPQSVRRVNWFRAVGFDAMGAGAVRSSQLISGPNESETPVTTPSLKMNMNRTVDDLAGILDDVDEYEHSRAGPRRARLFGIEEPAPRVVFTPSTLEESLDAAALTAALNLFSCPAAIAVSHPRRTGERWPISLTDIQQISIDAISDDVERVILFADGGAVRHSIITRFPRTDLVIRTSGLHAMDVYARGAARRYRDGDTILVRSRLEAAELGDRPCVMVPSGAFLAATMIWGDQEPTDDIVVLVPPALAVSPWAHAWTQIAVTAVQKLGMPVRLLSSGATARAINDLRAEPIDLQTVRNASTVITPLDGTASLVETLGGKSVIFDPTQDPDAVAAPWRRGARIAHTPEELVAALERADYSSADLRALTAFEIANDLETLGRLVHSAIFGAV